MYRNAYGAPPEVAGHPKDFAFSNLLGSLDGGEFGSATKDINALRAKRTEWFALLQQPSLIDGSQGGSVPPPQEKQAGPFQHVDILPHALLQQPSLIDGSQGGSVPPPQEKQAGPFQHVDSLPHAVIDVDADIDSNDPLDSAINGGKDKMPVIIVDSDDEDERNCDARTLTTPTQEGQSKQLVLYNEANHTMENHAYPNVGFRKATPPEVRSRQIVLYDKPSCIMDPFSSFRLNFQPSISYEKVFLQEVPVQQRAQHVIDENSVEIRNVMQQAEKHAKTRRRKHNSEASEMNRKKQRSMIDNTKVVSSDLNTPTEFPLGTHNISLNMQTYQENNKQPAPSDGLEELWRDMSLAMEFSKSASDEQDVPQQDEECNHSYLLQDDIGLVCRICGIIQKSIETIFDYQWSKGYHSIRTYMSTSRNHDDSSEKVHFCEIKISEEDSSEAEISIHPRHMKQMKPHQLEGFKFLVKNLVSEKPGGCILAHAPGSGKTFMLISFIQSFLAKYPSKRPLVVLPKGILTTWKKEFQKWQVEDMPLYDFYTVKADNRNQQLEVLKCWQEKKSILFLGYKQFSTIIFDQEHDHSQVAAACREMLLKVPSLLILDEGHTPRNENTNVLDSLEKVETPCKVVLSGTLFQNHVREVFTILNLVRPKFLKMESSRAIVKRMLSRLHISGGRKLYKGGVDNTFYDLVEENLQKNDNFKRKVTVIQDLREMTKDVLHYYRGDFLEELPGLIDFTVILKPSLKQKSLFQKLMYFDKFKRISVGSAVYMHPHLYDTAEKASGDRVALFNDQKIDSLIDSINIRDGVKTRFFLNILSLADSAGEKLLVFSQYILPLKFLERLVVRNKGWFLGREIFMITGDSSSEQREQSMEQFNNSSNAKVFFGSIRACGEGISLTGASRIVVLDTHLNPSVTRQAIGRAFRPGQTKKVYTYRLVAADSPEEEDHKTCFSKELISRLWFEWSEYCGHRDFELDEVDISNSQDMFLESPCLAEDIKALYKRTTFG